MDRETAKIILGAWLRGEHEEDIRLIPVAAFGDMAPVADQIRQGERDPVRLGRKCKNVIDMADASEMWSGKTSEIYDSALWAYREDYKADWLRKHANASDAEITAFLEENARNWMTGVPGGEDVYDVAAGYAEILDARRDNRVAQTGVADLDELSGGIMPGTLTAIGARPGTGKSAFCLQTAVNVARSGLKVMFFALEMTNAQNMDRLVMMYTRNINQRDLRSGQLTEDQWGEIGDAIDKIGEMKSHLVFSQERDIKVIEAMIKKHKPDFVVIDQLSQLTDKGRTFTSIRERFSEMTKALMDIVKNSTTAIWLACQVNRDANDSRPSLANLKESGSIEEDCDMVVLLSRDKDEEQARGDLNGNRVINVEVAKHRGGELGEFQLKFVVKRFGFVPLEEIPEGFVQTEEDISY